MSGHEGGPPLADPTRVLLLPLRGLASEGIEPVVQRALGATPGVLAVEVHATEMLVRVTYDATRTAPATLRRCLRALRGSGPGPGGAA